jgi:hypothetical protein
MVEEVEVTSVGTTDNTVSNLLMMTIRTTHGKGT